MPDIPSFQHGKRPVDVYLLLNECYARVSTILKRSGIEILTLTIPEISPDDDSASTISPSDVYDLSIILVSELAYLQGQIKETVAPVQQAGTRGFKVPSHVYQRGELLLRQLDELAARVEKNPDWLTQ